MDEWTKARAAHIEAWYSWMDARFAGIPGPFVAHGVERGTNCRVTVEAPSLRELVVAAHGRAYPIEVTQVSKGHPKPSMWVLTPDGLP